jgi:multidrug efflux pump subunit AcrB
VSLKEGHKPTSEYVRKLREALPAEFPESTFYFQAADIVTQILNFGLPAQIDVRTVGYDKDNNLRVAQGDAPADRGDAWDRGCASAAGGRCSGFYADIDRARAAQLGLNADTIATNVNVRARRSR